MDRIGMLRQALFGTRALSSYSAIRADSTTPTWVWNALSELEALGVAIVERDERD